MKRIITILFLLALAGSSYGQLPKWKEWVAQKKMQRKYLLEQIALLEVYLGHLDRGYNIVSNGLNTIHNIKNGDFNLHRDFFNSLKNVNPAIGNTAKVVDIAAFQWFLGKEMKRVYQFCESNGNFTATEVRYVAAVTTNLLFLSDASLSELLSIIRPQQTSMTDDERLERIDLLYEDTLDKHLFVQSFGNDVRMIASQRQRDRGDVQTIKAQYDDL